MQLNSLVLPHFRTSLAGLALLALVGLGNPALAAQRDQVLYRNAAGQAKTETGTVVENSLAKVRLDIGSRERDFDTASVDRVVFGDVPPAFAEGVAYFDRGDYENAAKQYQLAAGDAAARDVVKAAARLRAAESWMKRGASDASAFAQAKSEAEVFLADSPNNRDVPHARALLGRATWLGGDPAGAAEVFRALYQEAQGAEPTPGYSYPICYQSGVFAAQAFLATGDGATARALYNELSGALATLLASLDENDPSRGFLIGLQAKAQLGEGFCLLADGQNAQARTFFQGQLSAAGKANAAQRFGAQLGLAEALLADGNARQAEIEFAQVSAIDYTDRDNVARALVGLAECALQLSDADGRQQAKVWLQTVRDQYGDTPAVLRAQELSQTL